MKGPSGAAQLEAVRQRRLDMTSRFSPKWPNPFALMFAFLAIIIYIIWDSYRVTGSSPALPQRTASSSSLSIQQIASVPDLCIGLGDFRYRRILAIDHRFAYVTYDGTWNGGTLHLFDTIRGKESWVVGDLHSLKSMAASQSALYVIVNWEIRSYDLESGDLLWQSDQLPDRTGYAMVEHPVDKLIVHSSEDLLGKWEAVIREVDPSSGEFISLSRIPLSEYALIAPSASLVYLWLSETELALAPSPDTPAHWRVDTGDRIHSWPIEYKNVVLVSTGFFSRLLAIDVTSGSIIWHDNRDLISGPTVFNGVIYALTKDAQLVGLNPITGNLQGSIRFLPSTTEESTRSHLYAVSSSNDILIVYFGDSCEMFTYKVPDA